MCTWRDALHLTVTLEIISKIRQFKQWVLSEMSLTADLNDCYGQRAEGTGILPPIPKPVFHLQE